MTPPDVPIVPDDYQPPPGAVYVSGPEAALMLDVSTASISRWAATGYLPAVARTPGGRGRWYFDPDTVRALAAARRRGRKLLDQSGPHWRRAVAGPDVSGGTGPAWLEAIS